MFDSEAFAQTSFDVNAWLFDLVEGHGFVVTDLDTPYQKAIKRHELEKERLSELINQLKPQQKRKVRALAADIANEIIIDNYSADKEAICFAKWNCYFNLDIPIAKIYFYAHIGKILQSWQDEEDSIIMLMC